MTLVVEDIHHSFGTRPVLSGVELSVRRGEILCILGGSGDGKTTLLRLVAGLEPIQRGRILLDGRVIAEPGREIPPEARGIGLVFQDYALFPHLTVAGNVGFGLTRMPRAAREAAVAQALARVRLRDYAQAWPHQLSGGQQQRVALARALAPAPSVLLLDEAFGSLDARLRESVRQETRQLLAEAGVPALVVTHDAEEAMLLADRIILLRGGRVEQEGTPEELYLHPRTSFVARFLGEVNRLPAMVRDGVASTALGPFLSGLGDGPAELLVRPEGLQLAGPGQDAVECRVESCRLFGPGSLATLRLPVADGPPLLLLMHLPADRRLVAGSTVPIQADPQRSFVFPETSPDDDSGPPAS